MLRRARDKAEAAGILERCIFHEGTVDNLEIGEAFHAATALLVSHFMVDPVARTAFFASIAPRLVNGGTLVSADLTASPEPEEHAHLLGFWRHAFRRAGMSDEQIEGMFASYDERVGVRPPDEVKRILEAGGFHSTYCFYQAGLIRAWCSRAGVPSISS